MSTLQKTHEGLYSPRKKNTGGIMSTLLKHSMCIREKLHVMQKPNFCSYK